MVASDLCRPHYQKLIITYLYVGIGNGVENWFGTSNYSEDDKRPLPIGKNKKIISFFQDELGRKIMIEFVTLRPKTYSYLM